MNFSEWITIVSIFLAVLLAVFKYDEWEVIKLKSYRRYIYLPFLALIIGGFCAYYNTNPHPEFINFLWINNGWSPGLWAIISTVLFFTLCTFYWHRFTHSKPNENLIKKYNDFIEIMEPSKFSSIFRKYEQYFFNSKDKRAWIPYTLILINEKWWSIAPHYFKELVFKYPERFYEMDKDVLKALLKAQISKIPNSQITKEIEIQWNGVGLSENTPILNIFISTSYYIETGRNNNILLPTIKEVAEEYFTSLNFIENDKSTLCLEPSSIAMKQVAPKSLFPFYLIQLIDCYWKLVVKTKSEVAGFHFYHTWTKRLLNLTPTLKSDREYEKSPNLYVLAVKRMLNNTNQWVDILIENNNPNLKWAADHFIELNSLVIGEINENYLNKYPEQLLLQQAQDWLIRLIYCRKFFGEEYDPRELIHFTDSAFLKKTFTALTEEQFYNSREKEKPEYIWLKSLIGS